MVEKTMQEDIKESVGKLIIDLCGTASENDNADIAATIPALVNAYLEL